VTDHDLGDAAEDEPAYAAATVATDHDQLGLALGGGIDQAPR
jgi:hypothetical protein